MIEYINFLPRMFWSIYENSKFSSSCSWSPYPTAIVPFLLRLQRRTCCWTPCLLSVDSRDVTIIGNTWGSRGNFLGISSRAVDLTMRPYGGWLNEWINITWQCFIKSDSIYLYEYIILNIIAILRYFPLFLLSENFPSHASRDGKLSLIAKGC